MNRIMRLYSRHWRSHDPDTRIFAASTAMYASLKAGEIVEPEEHDTLSDGTEAGPGTMAFLICTRVIDDAVLVREDEL